MYCLHIATSYFVAQLMVSVDVKGVVHSNLLVKVLEESATQEQLDEIWM